MSLVKTVGSQNVLILQPDQSMTMAPDGSGEAKLSYRCTWSKVAKYVPTPLQPHPDFPSLLLYEFTTVREPGDIGRFDCVYRGVIAEEPMKLMQEEATAVTSTEPLESHPDFAGYRDSNGNLSSAPPVTPTDMEKINKALSLNTAPTGLGTVATQLYNRKLRGMDAYLRVGVSYKASFCQKAAPSMSDYSEVGKRWSYSKAATTFKNIPPTPSAGNADQDYIETEFSWRKMGGAFYINVGFQMSGACGPWDSIYKFA